MTGAILLFSQTCATAFLAGWLLTALKDNWLMPGLNGAIVRTVLRIEKIEADYPDAFLQLRHRRIESEAAHRLIFALIVLAETGVLILLALGLGAMIGAHFGAVFAETARGLALLGATGFTAIWAGFLILGNHWVYWYCHEWGQNSHFQLLLWGLGTMIFLTLK